jgi:outer membrane lipoprotein-sorting protein
MSDHNDQIYTKTSSKMKTKVLLQAVAGALLSIASYAQTVDEIVEKHVAALGGLDKINAVNTIVMERSIAVQGMEIPSKTTLVVGKSVRSESTIMGNSMIQVLDDGKGWMIRPAMMGGTGEPEDMPADQVKQMVGQLDPFGGLVGYKEKGSVLELVGKEKVDKNDVYHLKLTTKDGQVIDEYLDATTYFVTKFKMSVNGQDSEITLSDYKPVEGVQFANTLDIASPQGMVNLTTSKVIVNGKVDEGIFKRPVK